MKLKDMEAAMALGKQNKNLLPAGIVGVEGDFQRGDVVGIFDKQDKHIACGISNYSSADIAVIKGMRSSEILSLLGHEYGEEMVHRNNMVVV